MEYTEDKIENDKTLLPSLLKMFSMFKIYFWYNKGHYDLNKVEHITIRCINCGEKTGLSMYNMDTEYKDIINSFVLNTVLHHVCMPWTIKANKELEYDMDKHN